MPDARPPTLPELKRMAELSGDSDDLAAYLKSQAEVDARWLTYSDKMRRASMLLLIMLSEGRSPYLGRDPEIAERAECMVADRDREVYARVIGVPSGE